MNRKGRKHFDPALFVLNLPVALARAPGKVAYSFLISLSPWLEHLAKLPMGVEGGLKILLAWTLVDAKMAEYALACWRRLK